MTTNAVDVYLLQYKYCASAGTVLVYAGLWWYIPGIPINYQVSGMCFYYLLIAMKDHSLSSALRIHLRNMDGLGMRLQPPDGEGGRDFQTSLD